MIIRLIDIVLIVLFGFITISDIDIKGALSLPAKNAKPLTPPKDKRTKVIFLVEIDDSDALWITPLGKHKRRMRDIQTLESYLQNERTRIAQTQNDDIAVVIKPSEMSTLQMSIDVLDLCSRNRIPKNIARRSLALF